MPRPVCVPDPKCVSVTYCGWIEKRKNFRVTFYVFYQKTLYLWVLVTKILLLSFLVVTPRPRFVSRRVTTPCRATSLVERATLIVLRLPWDSSDKFLLTDRLHYLSLIVPSGIRTLCLPHRFVSGRKQGSYGRFGSFPLDLKVLENFKPLYPYTPEVVLQDERISALVFSGVRVVFSFWGGTLCPT